jgi:hypothetical protein
VPVLMFHLQKLLGGFRYIYCWGKLY